MNICIINKVKQCHMQFNIRICRTQSFNGIKIYYF